MDVDSQPTMEETILVGDDLMMGPPSPIIPPEIASHVLEGVDLCDGILKNLFLCLQINDIEPFCQDELAMYKQCAEKRDRELRKRLQDSEQKLGMSMPLNDAKERASQLETEVTSLDRYRRISPEMEFAWSPNRHQEKVGVLEAGNGEQERGVTIVYVCVNPLPLKELLKNAHVILV
ncbi:uncharacterized protein LOC112166455 isoform X1 [Rosa chinensis]|uniref:uncharacterized protein LOC112166455 isoform X1 n=1 Tax=Rosa chinensis TaxID=74649 RepID=UPI000D0900F2|nr:uncharacterized protein LOC112166455 isoform X1 [Rosa chinensis]